MSNDLFDEIRTAQIRAREQAVLAGRDPTLASVMAGEQAVIRHLDRIEAKAIARPNPKVVNLADYRQKKQ